MFCFSRVSRCPPFPQDYGDARAMWSSNTDDRVRYSTRKLKDRGTSLDELLDEPPVPFHAVPKPGRRHSRSADESVLLAQQGGGAGGVDWQDKWSGLGAVEVDGLLLQVACARLQGNKEVVLAAVAQNGTAIQHASLHLQHDGEVASAAVAQSWRALAHLRKALRDDKALALLAVAQNGNACGALSHRLCGDRDVIACGGALALKYASQALKADKLLVLAAVQADGLALEHAAKALQGDSDVCRAALGQNPAARRFCTKRWLATHLKQPGTHRGSLESLYDTVTDQTTADQTTADPAIAYDGMTLEQVLDIGTSEKHTRAPPLSSA